MKLTPFLLVIALGGCSSANNTQDVISKQDYKNKASLEQTVQMSIYSNPYPEQMSEKAGLYNEQAIKHLSLAHELSYTMLDKKKATGKTREELENALEDFFNVIKYAKNDMDSKVGYWHAGETYLFLGNYNKAIAMMNKTIELFPTDSECYWHRAIIKEWAGKYGEAIYDYDKMIALNPGTLIDRALALEKIGRYQEEINDLNKFIKTHPDGSFAYLTRGDAYGAMGKIAEAKADYKKAIELDPSNKIMLPKEYREQLR